MRSLLGKVKRINKKLLERNHLEPYSRCFLDDELDALNKTDMSNKLRDVTKYFALVSYQTRFGKELMKFNMSQFMEHIARDSKEGYYGIDLDEFIFKADEYAHMANPDFDNQMLSLCHDLGLPDPNFDKDDTHATLLWFRSVAARYIHDKHVLQSSPQECIKRLKLDFFPWNGADDIT